MGESYKNAMVSSVKDGMAHIRATGNRAGVVPISARPQVLKERALAIQAENEQTKTRWAKASPTPAGQIQTTVRVIQVMAAGVLATTSDGQTILIRNYPGAENIADGERVTFKG